MAQLDLFVWMDNDDSAVASAALRSLKKHVSANVAQWFLVGKRGDKLERLGYDVGASIVSKPASMSQLGELMNGHGSAEHVVAWSSLAVLLADWEPWQKSQSRLWSGCPCALLLRSELPSWTSSITDWTSAQALGAHHHLLLKDSQVKTLGWEDYEKALKGSLWPFGPAVLILQPDDLAR